MNFYLRPSAFNEIFREHFLQFHLYFTLIKNDIYESIFFLSLHFVITGINLISGGGVVHAGNNTHEFIYSSFI